MPPYIDDLSPREKLAILRTTLRNDLLPFSFKVFQMLSAGQAFQLSWHHEVIVDRLVRAARGEIKRLIICAPPRTGKSTIVSVAWPAFLLGRNPALRVIHASYASDLGAVFSNQFRRVVADPVFRELFPQMRIDPRKNTESEVATTAGGFRLSLSTGGSLTGRGGDIIIIDDSLKAADAFSETRREGVNDWYRNTVVSRLDDKRNGVIVLVMQRIHQDDLVGFVTSLSDDWHVLNLQAIAEQPEIYELSNGGVYKRNQGEALHPEREPLEILEHLRQQSGPDNFAAQYQQNPIPPGGAMIKRAWLGRYDFLPNAGWIRIVQSWDTANKGGGENDYSACVTAIVHQNCFYIIDVHRGRYDYPALKEKVLAHAHRYQPSNLLIEDAGVGTALIAELRGKRSVTAVLPTKDKATRMSIASDKIRGGQMLLPNNAAWLSTFEAELLAFPNTKHDDQVDALSQLLTEAGSGYTLDNI